MQPGNAAQAGPSHLTTADQVNKDSEGLTFTDHKDPSPSEEAGRPWTWMQPFLVQQNSWEETDVREKLRSLRERFHCDGAVFIVQ